jgi:hypothetical protein
MTTAELDILDRLIGNSWQELPAPSARAILRLKLPKKDVQRINKLSTMAQEGKLSPRDRSELEGYLYVGRMVSLMHSYARRALKFDKGGAPSRRKAS